MVVKVAVEKVAYHFDKLYRYFLPEHLSTVQRGCRVLVPFGGGNRRCQGIVIERDAKTDFRKLKPVFDVLDTTPLFTDEQLRLAVWMKERTFCSLFEAAYAMLPPGLYLRIQPRYRLIAPNDREQWDHFLPEQREIIFQLSHAPDGLTARQLQCSDTECDPAPIAEELVQAGLVEKTESAVRVRGDATVRMARLEITGAELRETVQARGVTEKQGRVLNLLKDADSASVKELCYFASVTPAVITSLQKKGFVRLYEVERLRSPAEENIPVVPQAKLNKRQQEVYEGLAALCDSGQPQAALLFGVTGSGKTQVYMHLIDHVLSCGRQAMVLVPEISLTPQLMKLFWGRFGQRVALLHSGLSIGERMDEWKRVRRGDADIVLGTRSAVFAPLDHIGLIVMDEEQEHTYKSDSSPRYHTRDIVRYRCAQHHALMLLSSATPSVESFHYALSGRYHLFRLPARFGGSRLPKVQIVDMRANPPPDGILSEPMAQALSDCFSRGRQAILLYNRRGYHTFISCRRCGQVITCPQCSISLTYHAANDSLMCHYCGFVSPVIRECPVCGGETLRFSGVGTQKVEEVLQKRFPDISVLRMDADTAASRLAYEKRFQAFAEGEYQLMVGTQMVAKGLDFPNVSLVGVLSADLSLFGDDYRSYETTFSLLTQVIGRAGRREEEGLAVIQTFNPNHEVILQAARQDYEGFYASEIPLRKTMSYPPYTDLVMFAFSGLLENEVKAAATLFLSLLTTLSKGDYREIKMIVLSPTPAVISRMAGKYRFKLIMKTLNNALLRQMIDRAICAYYREPISRRVTVSVDINPSDVI